MSVEDVKPTAMPMFQGRNGRFPIEIVENMIAFLDVGADDSWDSDLKDQQTLARCALVSHDWLPFSLYKLYDNIILKTRRQWDCFVRLLLDSPPRIAPYLRSARRLHIQPVYTSKVGWKAGMVQPWDHLVLFQCAKHLTGLVHIQFIWINWGRPHCRDYLLFATHNYISLTRLRLYDCEFRNIYQLRELVCGFPALSDLSLLGVTFKRSITAPTGSRQGPRLKRLETNLNHDAVLAVTRLLIDTCSVQSLIKLDWQPWDAYEALHDLLAAVNGSLEDLDFVVQPSVQCLSLHQTIRYRRLTSLSLAVDLSSHRNLKKLRLHYAYQIPVEAGFIKEILYGLSTRRLEELTIELFSHRPALKHAEIDKFKQVDSTLSLPQFNSLKCVKIITYDAIIFDDITASPHNPSSPDPAGIIADSSSQSSLPDVVAMLPIHNTDEELSMKPVHLLNGDVSEHVDVLDGDAKDVLQGWFKEALKQVASRGILRFQCNKGVKWDTERVGGADLERQWSR